MALATAPAFAAGKTERVSVGPDGVQGDLSSGGAALALSADGRFVAFASFATNLVPGDTDVIQHVFVHDRQRGRTERVSVGPGGVPGNGTSGDLGIVLTANGRFVAFTSDATNLVPRDTNGSRDVFVHDRQRGRTERVSVGPGGVQAAGSDAGSVQPSISADGRLVAFFSDATNLVAGDTNRSGDVFIRDRETGTTERVSVGPGGVEGDSGSGSPALSVDGRFVAFTSFARNLVPGVFAGGVIVRDRETSTNELVSVGPGGVPGDGESFTLPHALSANGRFVAFSSQASNLVPRDTNRGDDVFVHDRKTGKTERVSVGPRGAQGRAFCDEDGFCFSSSGGAISADGRFVAFRSLAPNLVRGDTNRSADCFVRDRKTRKTERVSVGPRGRQGNADSCFALPAISADGRLVAFDSNASNLVPGDTNDTTDVFVRRR